MHHRGEQRIAIVGVENEAKHPLYHRQTHPMHVAGCRVRAKAAYKVEAAATTGASRY